MNKLLLRSRLVKGKKTASCPFTLIELLVVMGIMVILLGLAAPAFNKIALGSGPPAAVRQISSTLRQARQLAIAQRTNVAVIFPDDQNDFADSNDKPFQSLHVCTKYQDSAPKYKFAEGTKWIYLPQGAVLEENFTSANFLPVDVDANGVDPNGTGAKTFSSVPAVVFKPSGALNHDYIQFDVIEGAYDGSHIVRNTENKFTITINRFTGRVRVE